MQLSALITALTLSASGLTSAIPTKRDVPQTTLYTPASDYNLPGVLYARTVALCDGSILATWENYSPEPPAVYFPIYKSTDGGATFQSFSQIDDQVNGRGLRYQPFLYELPADWAGYKAGTILAAGNSIPTDLSLTKIDVYYSTDGGLTWTFASSVASGGEALPNNGLTPVWEPFLLLPPGSDELICYYSDQRDPKYGQKLTHQTTKDLATWSDTVDDVTSPTYSDRPGMTIVSALPNGHWILTFEFGGAPEGDFTAYYKLSPSPYEFGLATAYPIQGDDGSFPSSSPYNVWVPAGGENGTIIANSMSQSDLYLNDQLGAVGTKWRRVPSGVVESYTRSLTVLNAGKDLLITGGGMINSQTLNNVTYGVDSVDALIGG